jgi:hypothetical protein
MPYDNRDSVILFKNDDKRDERDSDYSGTWTDENGVEHWADCWINTSKSGKKFLKIKKGGEKEQRRSKPRQQAEPPPQFADDDLPF